MPPLPVIASVNRVALEWLDDTGQTAVNVIHISTEGTPQDVHDAIADGYSSNLFGLTADTAAVVAMDILPLDGTSGTTTLDGAGIVGAAGGQFGPALAGIVKFSTGLRGREHRGRIYMPFITEGVNDDGFVSEVNADAVTAAWDDFRAALLAFAEPCELVVASYKLATASSIISSTCERPLGTMRRRQQRNR